MNITLPNFQKYVDFRELSPQEGDNIYRYITLKPIIIKYSGLVPKNVKISCRDSAGREWLYIDSKHFIILKGYTWDGCSPKNHIPIFGWVGTIDFQKTILASLAHDAFVQFCNIENFPLSRKSCDKIFYEILKLQKFKLLRLYHMGVKIGTFINYVKSDTGLKVILTYSDNTLNKTT